MAAHVSMILAAPFSGAVAGGASPSGKAGAFEASIRWFESSRPSHMKNPYDVGVFRFVVRHANRCEEKASSSTLRSEER